MSNKLYDILNKIQRWLPSLGAFWFGIAALWGLPFSDEVNKTIALVATFLAATLEAFSAQWNKDHQIVITDIRDFKEGTK